MLALLPMSHPLVVRLCWPGDDEPLRISVGQRTRLFADEHGNGSQARNFDALLAPLWPDARFSPSSRRPLLRPQADEPVPIHRPQLASKPSQSSHPLIENVESRAFHLTAALGILTHHTPCELVLRLTSIALDAAARRAITCARANNLARSAVHRQIRLDELAGESLATLEETACAVRIEVVLRSQASIDAGLANMVSLALFGAPADLDPPPDARVDLRCLWPLGAPLPALLPTQADVRSLEKQRRCSRPCAPDRRGAVMVGQTPCGEDLWLSARDRARHCFVIGATGSGKSTLLLNMMRQDIVSGEGVTLIDPHGDLADAARGLVPVCRRNELVWADVCDPASAMGLNILEGQGGMPELERNYVANPLVRLFKYVLYRDVPEAFGPMFEVYFRNALMLLMASAGGSATLCDFERIFRDTDYRHGLIKVCPDPKVSEFWTRIAERATWDEIKLENVAPYIVCKLTQLTGNPLVRRMIEARGEKLDLRTVMDCGGIALIKLAKGLIGEYDATLIATMQAIRLAQVAMARTSLPAQDRRLVRVYIDEFQTCAGDAIGNLLAETRKYGLSLTLANQTLSQIDGRGSQSNAGDLALANAANLIAFRLGAPDALNLAPWFAPEVPWPDLCRLPDFHAMARALEDGQPRRPGIIKTAPPPQGN